MLYGIRPEEQKRIADRGDQMRVYIPYGEEWYGYLMRRMAERPANTVFFLRGARDQGLSRWRTDRDLRRRRHGRDPALRADPLRAATPGDLVVTERRPDRADAARPSSYGVRVLGNAEAADGRRHARARASSRRTWPACSPRSATTCAPGNLVVSPRRRHHDRATSSRGCPRAPPVVRVMPNTPALVDQGMAAISPGQHCDDEHLAEAEALLALVRQGRRGSPRSTSTPSPRSPAAGRPTSSTSSRR